MKFIRCLLCLSTGLMALAFCPSRSRAELVFVANQTVQFSEASFDKSNFNQLTVVGARRRCEDLLAATMALVDLTADLTEGQRNRLELAGQVDIHRFFYGYASTKRTLKFGTLSKDDWQAQFAEAQKKILPLKTRFAEGLHDDSSLYSKTLVTTLEEDQYERVQAIFDQREQNQYSTHIGITLAMVDRKIPLTVEQRNRITQLLLTKTEPPKSYGTSNTPIFKVLSRMELITDELGKILSEQEMAVMADLIQAGKTGAAQRVFLQ